MGALVSADNAVASSSSRPATNATAKPAPAIDAQDQPHIINSVSAPAAYARFMRRMKNPVTLKKSLVDKFNNPGERTHRIFRV